MTFTVAKPGYRLHVHVLVINNRSQFPLLLRGLEVNIRTQYHLVAVINIYFVMNCFQNPFFSEGVTFITQHPKLYRDATAFRL